MLRGLQAHIFPGFTAIYRLIDTIAKTDMAATVIFTGSYPDNVRITWINGHITSGVYGLIFKYWCPGCA